MVCVMTFCPEMAQAAVEKPMPCHGAAKNTDRAPMLAGDCLQNDLGQGITIDIPLPFISFILVSFILPLTFVAMAKYAGHRLVLIDPPPRRRPSFHRILITQRILQ
jgi:hypothetical protein